jgi:hypothetical protein
VTAHDAGERLAAEVQAVREAKAAEGRAATPEELEQVRRLFDEDHEAELREWNYRRWHTWRPPGPRPEWPAEEWETLEAELLEPSPAPRGLLVELDAATLAALGELEKLRRVGGVDERAAEKRQAEAESGLGEDLEPDPRSNPDELEKKVLWNVVQRLQAGEELASIERTTGLSHRKVLKIRDWRDHPGRLGPHGRPGFALYPGQTPHTVSLRKLRRRRFR